MGPILLLLGLSSLVGLALRARRRGRIKALMAASATDDAPCTLEREATRLFFLETHALRAALEEQAEHANALAFLAEQADADVLRGVNFERAVYDWRRMFEGLGDDDLGELADRGITANSISVLDSASETSSKSELRRYLAHIQDLEVRMTRPLRLMAYR